jgi:lysophospholipid acyltransferase (LPLAT)-like uncharacterized protein
MPRSFLSRYSVDKVPVLLRPLFYLYGYGCGLLLFFFFAALRTTARVQLTGREKLRQRPNHIFCLWHSFVPSALVCAIPLIPAVLDNAPQAWMQHPDWYMKPIHVLLRLMGVRTLILGSTGHAGRDAADHLVARLRQGFSTVMNPDGPHGPAFVLKKGILHVALKSGVPVVALNVSSSRYCELNTWDRKKFVPPFCSIVVNVGEPIHVTRENFDRAHRLIETALGVDVACDGSRMPNRSG